MFLTTLVVASGCTAGAGDPPESTGSESSTSMTTEDPMTDTTEGPTTDTSDTQSTTMTETDPTETDPTETDPTETDPTETETDSTTMTTLDPPECGDGNVDMDEGEECDEGIMNDDEGACTSDCLLAWCGDGKKWLGMEECDDGNNIDTDDCLSTCVAASCRDGNLWEGVEECDDGNDVDVDECPNTCHKDRVVFVTSFGVNGAMENPLLPPGDNGVSAADTICQEAAPTEGKFRAWLGDDQFPPGQRFFGNGELPSGFKGNFRVYQGDVIAAGWSELTDGMIDTEINMTEKGLLVLSFKNVWTGLMPDGSLGTNCNNWTSSSDMVKGVVGRTEEKDSKWTNDDVEDCDGEYRLYCFQTGLTEP